LTPLAVIGFRVLGGRPGLALLALSVVEQRYWAVMAVLDGARVTEVAVEVGGSRQSLHAWVARYREAGLAGAGGSLAAAAVEPESGVVPGGGGRV
jgi:Homeodomain-like domain